MDISAGRIQKMPWRENIKRMHAMRDRNVNRSDATGIIYENTSISFENELIL